MASVTTDEALARGAFDVVVSFIGRDDSTMGGVMRAVNRFFANGDTISPGVAAALVRVAGEAWLAARQGGDDYRPPESSIPLIRQTPSSLDDPPGDSTFHYKYIIVTPTADGNVRIPAIWESQEPMTRAEINAYLKGFTDQGRGDAYPGGLQARLAPTGPPRFIPISVYQVCN